MLTAALNLLPLVSEALRALPEFRRLYEEIAAGLDEGDQQTLKAALELAFDRRDEAHQELQDLVRQYGQA